MRQTCSYLGSFITMLQTKVPTSPFYFFIGWKTATFVDIFVIVALDCWRWLLWLNLHFHHICLDIWPLVCCFIVLIKPTQSTTHLKSHFSVFQTWRGLKAALLFRSFSKPHQSQPTGVVKGQGEGIPLSILNLGRSEHW